VTDAPPPARPKRGYLGPGVIALVALVGLALLINYTALSTASPHTLAGTDAATLVSQGLQAQQGTAEPPQVTCPESEPIRNGLTFVCQWHQAGGATVPIHVTETNGAGRLSFTSPTTTTG
jgi:hypothetical protein